MVGDHVIIMGTPRPRDTSCLPYWAVADSNRNQWGLPDGGAKPDRSCNAADSVQGKLGVRLHLFIKGFTSSGVFKKVFKIKELLKVN